MNERPILIIGGTNRPNANALRVARIVAGHYAAAGIAAEIFSLIDLPREIFEPTAYASKPQSFLPIQQRVLSSAGLHVIVPEYNGSFPGAMKYFIDMLKFPESFERKPVAFIGEAAGIWGGLRAVEQLQMVFGYRNAFVFPERVFVSAVSAKFDADGQIIDSAIDQRLARQALGFAQFAQYVDQSFHQRETPDQR
jgi:chromate reductase, NAD(P)H dehydrogenase (quinone)